MWTFANAANTGTANGLLPIVATYTTKVVFTGTHLGRGMVGAMHVGVGGTGSGTANAAKTTVLVTGNNLLNAASTGATIDAVHDTFIRELLPPAGGVMQFKGLANTTASN